MQQADRVRTPRYGNRQTKRLGAGSICAPASSRRRAIDQGQHAITRNGFEHPVEHGGCIYCSLDVNSAGVRALLFDSGARAVEGYRAELATRPHAAGSGVPSASAAELAGLTIDCLDDLHRQVQESRLPVAAVALSVYERPNASETPDAGGTTSSAELFFAKLFGNARKSASDSEARDEASLTGI